MITHYDDGVGVFGPELAIQAPEWLGDTAERHPTVPKGMRWMPTTSFFQVLVDMKNAANVVPGVFAARGHDYRADLLPFFHRVLGLQGQSRTARRDSPSGSRHASCSAVDGRRITSHPTRAWRPKCSPG